MKIALLVIVILLGLYLIGKRLMPQGATSLPDNPYLVDVRTVQEFAGGSVPGAINIPLSTVDQSIDMFKGKENIVVFCRSGNRSGQAKTILALKGIDDVINGGSWQNVRDLLQK